MNEKNWVPLRQFGTVKETSNGYVTKFQRKKKLFSFSDHDGKEKALEAANAFLSDKTISNCKVNTFTEQDNDTIQVLVSQEDPPLVFTIDKSDLDKIKDHYWRPRKFANTMSIFTTRDKKRVYLKNVLLPQYDQVSFINEKDFLNFRKSNLIGFHNNNQETITEDVDADNDTETSIEPGYFKRFCFAQDQQIYIPTREWIQCRLQPKKNTSEMLANDIYSMFPKEFPLPLITSKDMVDSFHHLINSTPSLTEENHLLSQKWGQTICNQYFQRQMLNVTNVHRGGKNMDGVWQDEASRTSLFKSCLLFQFKELSNSMILKTFALKFYKASNFPPVVARFIYDYLQRPIAVLDPCSGFGGRFVGFWASQYATKYVGIDPNSTLVDSYRDMTEWLINHFPQPHKEFEFIQEEAQNIDYLTRWGQVFDVVMTSPPYFNREKYVEEDTQSSIRFKTFEAWKQGFLFPSIEKSLLALKQDGLFILNIKGDLLCRDTIEFMTNRMNLELVHTWYLRLNKRHFGAQDKSLNLEEIFVFKKR